MPTTNPFYEYVTARCRRLLASLPSSAATVKVIDVIFFPELHHCPMVRLDGSGMSDQDVTLLESSHESIMVRQESLAAAANNDAMSKLRRGGFDRYFHDRSSRFNESELLARAKEYLISKAIDLKGLLLWEIDVSDGIVTIRLAGDTTKTDLEFTADKVTIEYVSNIEIETLTALLGYYDYCKLNTLPFIPSLINYLSAS